MGTDDLFSRAEVAKARQEWGVVIKGEGGCCPVCDRFGRIHARPINATMVASLVWLIGAPESARKGWVHVPSTAPRFVVKTNQLSALRWWKLAEYLPGYSGFWRATETGKAFARGDIPVERKAHIYNADVLWLDGGPVFARDVDPGYTGQTKARFSGGDAEA